MTKAKNSTLATDIPSAAAPAGADASVRLAAVGAAFIALSTAVAAVARFPNSPVPPSLVDRISIAEDLVRAAIEDLPAEVAVGVTSSAYDDAWIRAEFEGLSEGLKAKFEDVVTRDDFEALGRGVSELEKAAQIPNPAVEALTAAVAELKAEVAALGKQRPAPASEA